LIGHVVDCCFDDDAWFLRCLVIETGSWLSSRRVLISPLSIGTPDWSERVLPVSMTIDQVRHIPDLDLHADPHLRSCAALLGYHVQAADGSIGHVQDLLLDEETWAIRYLVVNTSNWWIGHEVLIAPRWIQEFRWAQREVSVVLDQHGVRTAPPYDPAKPPDRRHEEDLHEHHGRIGYWVEAGSRRAGPRAAMTIRR
jgi:sporulation protein YlmC with PRC-barrel domain